MRGITYTTMVLAEGDTHRSWYATYHVPMRTFPRKSFSLNKRGVMRIATTERPSGVIGANDVREWAHDVSERYATPQWPAFEWGLR